MEATWLLGSTRLSDKAIKTFSTFSQRTGQVLPRDCINLSIMMSSSLVFSHLFLLLLCGKCLWLVREMKTNVCLIGPPWTEKVCSREEWISGEAKKMDLLKLHITMVVRKESKQRGWSILNSFDSSIQGGDRLFCNFSIFFSIEAFFCY